MCTRTHRNYASTPKTGKTPVPKQGSGHNVPLLAKKLFTNDSSRESKESVFFNGVILGVAVVLQGRLTQPEIHEFLWVFSLVFEFALRERKNMKLREGNLGAIGKQERYDKIY